MSPIILVPTIIIVVALMLGFSAFSAIRNERLAQIGTRISESALFEQGLYEARKKSKRVGGKQSAWAILLNKAGITLSERIFGLLLGAVMLCCIIGASLVSLAAVGFLLALMVPIIAYAILRHKSTQNHKRLNAQLLKAYTEITLSLKSSMTLKNAIKASTEYLDDPLRSEFVRVCADIAVDVNTPLSKALADMAVRTQNPQVRNLAIGVQKQESRKGSSPVSLLESLIEDINDTLNAERERDTQVANMRFNRTMLALFVPGAFIFMCTMNPKWLHFYTSEPLGWAVIGIAIIAEIAGLLISSSIMKLR